jgi:hypothetical protein
MSRVSHLLIHAIALERKAPESQGRGVFTDNYQPLASVQGRVMAASGRELLQAQQLRVEGAFVAYFESDLDVRLDDAFDGPAGSQFAGRRFRVTATLPPSVAHHLKVLCEEIQTARAAS